MRVMSLFLSPVYDSGFPGIVVSCVKTTNLAEDGRF
jgi:hypothetical protein